MKIITIEVRCPLHCCEAVTVEPAPANTIKTISETWAPRTNTAGPMSSATSTSKMQRSACGTSINRRTTSNIDSYQRIRPPYGNAQKMMPYSSLTPAGSHTRIHSCRFRFGYMETSLMLVCSLAPYFSKKVISLSALEQEIKIKAENRKRRFFIVMFLVVLT